ncbi:Gar1/Naf1 RNA binding region-domain-containing protein [Radiomyces spectabilis]|uniref:Gar1/Naf1 RNA binding region-domain-containing protein n=1 Tax=Radiomyces spectabilis TaxID=64574 RepID=UPI00222087A3|nr:Gar1/Naf1 RNA binding region-domain-containing protein [Radiomyces spectabilis]KAI8388091.1 Gar1/Naf1 RNA binding region-domain-containing protein [Radiomyces spectabilis]
MDQDLLAAAAAAAEAYTPPSNMQPELPVSTLSGHFTNSSTPSTDQNTPVMTVRQKTVEVTTVTAKADSAAEANLDAALASAEKAAGYESSDIDMSSSDENSSESESEGDKNDDIARSEAAVDQDDLDDDDIEESFKGETLRTEHEITDIPIERPVFEITPSTVTEYVGDIHQIIDNVIVVQSRPTSRAVLDMGSLFLYDNKEIMGEVFETFGPVDRPFYSVRFNTPEEMDAEFSKTGNRVLYVPSYHGTKWVETEKLKQIKGTDASNRYDEEISESEMEFSDDEKEQMYKRRKRQLKKGVSKRPRNAPASAKKRVIPAGNDFDSELSAYESSLPGRSIQSYADIYGADVSTAPAPAPAPAPVPAPAPAAPVVSRFVDTTPASVYQASPAPQNISYRSPSDIVSALFGSADTTVLVNANQSAQPSRPQPETVPSQSTPQTEPAQPQQPQQQTKSWSQSAFQKIRSLFAAPPPPSSDD